MARAPRHERGQALVETAIVLPILLVILLAIFDFGRAIYAYHTVGNAARTAGREAIVNQNANAIEANALAQAIALGLTSGDVSICFESSETAKRSCPTDIDNCNPKAIGCLALVEVRYSFAAVTPLIGAIVGPIAVSSTTVVPIESVASREPQP